MRILEEFEWGEPILCWLQNTLPLLGGFSIATTIAYIRECREGSLWRHSPHHGCSNVGCKSDHLERLTLDKKAIQQIEAERAKKSLCWQRQGTT
ncbi:MAG: hypothetical protein ACRCZ3_00310 [Providencia rustigianii]|uniref:hypothetical protein n=1 Tax=Providencia rustigianii TaxID=158850 RepID=UPI003F38AE89